MNKRNQRAKKCFALFLSFIMVVCMMPQFAFAVTETEAETAPATDAAPATVSVNFTSQANNAFLHGPQFDTEVSADLAESYGYTDSVSPAVSALDVLVKAHQVKYGDEFKKENAADMLQIAEDGTVTKFFGIETDKFGFTINARLAAYGASNIEVTAGDTLEFFVYQNDSKTDHYVVFSKTYSSSLNRLEKTPAVTGAEKTFYLFGYEVNGTENLSDEEILAKGKGMVGLQLGIVDAETGSITPIEGAISEGSTSRVAFTIQETKDCYITAYVPDTEITQGEVPAILPILKTELVRAPQLGSLEIYESQQAYESGEEPFSYTPELTSDMFTGYSVVLPDYLSSVFLAAKLPGGSDIIKGRFTYEDLDYTMMTRSNSMGYTWSSSGYSRAVWDKGYLDFYFSGDAGSKLNNYQINVTQYATLKDLEVEGVMQETFDRTKTEYHAYVDSSKSGIEIKATPYKSDYTMTAGGADVTNGEAYTLTYDWNEDGKMIVPIVVKGNNKQETTYMLTLEKMPREDTPCILTQPEGAEYTVLDTTINELKVVASANGTLKYQWYKSSSEGKQDAQAIAGATESVYTPKNDTAETAYYFCHITNSEKNKSIDSELAKIVVYADPTPVVKLETTIPEITDKAALNGYEHPDDHGFVYNVGDQASPLTASYTLPVEGGTVAYERWYYTDTKDNDYGSTNSTMASKSFTPGTTIADAKDGGVWYFYKVSYQFKGKTYTAVSPKAYFYVYTDKAMVPEISTQPTSAEYTVGDRVAPLSTRVKYGTYISASYQWYVNTTDSTTGGTPIEGATSSTYLPPTPAADVGTNYYYCVVTNTQQGLKESVTSDVAAITIKEKEKVQVPLNGEGTEEKPYEINSQTDLEVVASLAADGYSFEDDYLKLTKDIDIDTTWQGIGSVNGPNTANGVNLRPFSGILDGGGFTITFAEGCKALLKYSREATVRNLNILAPYMNDYALLSNYVVDYGEDGIYNTGTPATISIENVTLKGGSVIKKGGFLGGGASGLNVCTFANCTVEENVKIGYDKTKNASSGLSAVGSFAGNVNGTFIGCISYADVYGVDSVGGICGAKAQSMGPYVISNSSFFGDIHAEGNYVGGIAGAGYYSSSAPNSPCASIQNCSVAANITGKNNVGGIFGGESAIYQNWSAAYIRDNAFSGTLTATDEGANVGGIVGYMYSLNKYNVIENNYYCAGDINKPVGAVKYVDTDCASHEKDSGAEYINTSVELPNMTGISKKDLNRSDDPLGKDKETLGKAMTATQMADGTVADLLNQSDSSYKNWITEDGVPVHSSTPVVYALQLGGSYKTEYQVGESLDTAGMTVTGKLTDGSTKEIPLSDCKFSGFDGSRAGNPEITVSYGAAKASYTVTVRYAQPENTPVTIRILGDTVHGEPTAETGTHTLAGGGLMTWVSESYTDFNQNNTVWEVIQKALSDHNMTCSNPSGNYIESITRDGVTIGEFSNGNLSGWMYTINGTHSQLGVSEQFIKKGDVIVLHYTDNYEIEEGSDKWTVPSEPTQPVTQNAAATVKDGEATSKLTASDADKLAEAAVQNSAATIEVNVTGADKADKVSVELPKTSVSSIASKTDAALQVTTPQGIVTLDKQAMNAAVKGASGSDLTIVLTKEAIADASKEPLGSAAAQTRVSILSGGKEITDLGTAKVKILLPAADSLKDKAMAAAVVDEDGKLTKTEGKLVTVGGKTYYQIETAKPGAFVVAESANIDAAIKAQAAETDDEKDKEKIERIRKGVQNTTIKITKTSKGKGWIKINWKKSKGYKVDYYEVFRKTGKNSKFGKTAFYKTKKHGITGSYKNTKSLKKGKRYYYKVRGVRVIDGKKYYTKWSKTYYRIAK